MGLFTLGEAARRLGVEPRTLYELIESGRLGYHTRDDHGRLWFDRASVDRCALIGGTGIGGTGVGKAVDDGRPTRNPSPMPGPSLAPDGPDHDEPPGAGTNA